MPQKEKNKTENQISNSNTRFKDL
uniref:Uncharacterized protein n=1 Tax=Rhizophora mucronata TaxID=61149 RepID=A0A2P2KID3_RHIMU